MTGYQGFDQPQGPGWWQASDGKWYPPESAPGARPALVAPTVAAPQLATSTPTPSATRPPSAAPGSTLTAPSTRTQLTPSRRPPMPLIGALVVLVLGAVLAVVGFVAGGPDESGRAERRDRIGLAEGRVAQLEDDASAADAAAEAVLAQAGAYLLDADAILTAARDGCDCSQGISSGWDAFLAASDEFYANPSDATQATLNDIIENRLNPEGDRLLSIQDSLRTLMADRTMVPEASP